MPKKVKTNPKALEARERKETQKQEAKAKAAKEKDDALWADEPTAQQKRKAEKEAKAAAEAKKRADKKALLEADLASVEKAKPQQQKPTRVQFLSLAERREQEALKAREEDQKKKERIVEQPELVQNANHVQREQRQADEARFGKDNIIEAQTLDAAVTATKLEDAKDDKHPEKRMKAAFAEFSEKTMPGLKADHPSLKLSQLKEMLFKQWQKSPDNPMNKKQDA